MPVAFCSGEGAPRRQRRHARLSALADKVVLRGADQLQQLVITGHYANGGIRDLTRQVKYRALDPQIVRVDANGLLTSTKNGTTEVVAELQGKTAQSEP